MCHGADMAREHRPGRVVVPRRLSPIRFGPVSAVPRGTPERASCVSRTTAISELEQGLSGFTCICRLHPVVLGGVPLFQATGQIPGPGVGEHPSRVAVGRRRPDAQLHRLDATRPQQPTGGRVRHRGLARRRRPECRRLVRPAAAARRRTCAAGSRSASDTGSLLPGPASGSLRGLYPRFGCWLYPSFPTNELREYGCVIAVSMTLTMYATGWESAQEYRGPRRSGRSCRRSSRGGGSQTPGSSRS